MDIKIRDRIHWHYVGEAKPELTSKILPYCKVRTMQQLWICRDWEKITCSRCNNLKRRADKARLKGFPDE